MTRKGYGGRGLDKVFPLDGSLNLGREKYSHGLRTRVAEAVVKSSFDDAVRSVSSHTGGHVPKRQAEQLAQVVSQDFAAYYQGRTKV